MPDWIIDWLIEEKGRADYFEHVLMEMGYKTGHKPEGCKWCNES